MKLWLMAGVLMGMAGVALGEGKLPFEVGKETTRIAGPLRADGTVDYVAAVNEKYRVKPEENGAVVLLQVMKGPTWVPDTSAAQKQWLKAAGIQEALDARHSYVDLRSWLEARHPALSETDAKVRNEVFFSEFIAGKEHWEESTYPELMLYLKSQEGALNAIGEAGERRRWWLPQIEAHLWTRAEPRRVVVASMGWAARSMLARAMLTISTGDQAGSLKDLRAIAMLARTVQRGDGFHELVASQAILEKLCDTVAAMAGEGRLTTITIASLVEVLKTAEPVRDMRAVIDVRERWKVLDWTQSWIMEDKDLMRELPPSLGEIERSELDWNEVLREINRVFDEQMKIVGRDLDGIDAGRAVQGMENQRELEKGEMRKGRSEARKAYSMRVARQVLHELGVGYAFGEFSRRELLMRMEMTHSLLAAARIKAATGEWPKTLEELVPDELQEVPVDLFFSASGREKVKYLVKGGKARVYSIGYNGVDDGGVRGDDGTDDLWVGARW